MSDEEIQLLARRIAYRYFDQAFDGDPETLVTIVKEEIQNTVKSGDRDD
jgi:hypothetical protein